MLISRGWATRPARRTIGYSYAAAHGDTGERGLGDAFETDPRRYAEPEPFIEEAATGVRCGCAFTFAVDVKGQRMRAVWPEPGSDRETVRAALTEGGAELHESTAGEASSLSVTFERERE